MPRNTRLIDMGIGAALAALVFLLLYACGIVKVQSW
jgi:hypothetical protein